MDAMNSLDRMGEVAAFDEYRPLLFAIAYRMLGSVMDAEDMVQETFLRWQAAPQADVRAPKAYLTSVITRLCIDVLRSAKARREAYIGAWLPEPLVTEGREGVEAAMLSDSLSTAFLVLLEQLGPTERAVFLLREVFDYEYAEIAAIVGKSEANCRQMVTRARQHIREGRPRVAVARPETERVFGRFVQSLAEGDVSGLLALLAPDVTLVCDGGGKATAARNPVHGPDRVTRFLLGIQRKAPPGFTARLAWINGQPGVIGFVDGAPNLALSLAVEADRVVGVYLVLNPDKLGALAPLAPGAPPADN